PRALVPGDGEPCWTCDVAAGDLIARAATREEAEQLMLVPETLKLHLQGRIDARFGERPLDFPAANLAEQVADGAVDALQVEAASPCASTGTLHRLRSAASAQAHRLWDLVRATDRQIAARESGAAPAGWS